jgi:tetratricopeptide (TPR) repeat protein
MYLVHLLSSRWLVKVQVMEAPVCTSRILLSFFVVFLCQGPSFADDYMLKLGDKYYKAGDYQNAANSWQSSLAANPKNAYAHYMLANALVNLKQNAQAGAEYTKAAELDPNGPIGTYSKQALATLTRQYANAGQRSVANSAVPQRNSQSTSAQQTASPPEMSDDEKRLNAECDTKISQINRETDDKIRALRQEQNDRLNANGQTAYRPITVGFGPYGPVNQYVPYYDPAASNDAVNREYAMKEDAVKGQGLQRIAETKAYYAKRIAAFKGH